MARPKTFDENEVLDKAMQVFWHKGYEATSIQELVTVMGINRGSLYDTFGDKHSLFLTVLERYRNQSNERFAQILHTERLVKAALRRLFTFMIDEALTDPHKRGCLMTNSTVELSSHDEATLGCINHHRERVEAMLGAAFEQAQQNGEISAQADPQALAHFFFSSLQGIRVVGKAHQDRQMLENVARLALSVLD